MSFRSPALTFNEFRLNVLAAPRHVTHRVSAAKRHGKLGERRAASDEGDIRGTGVRVWRARRAASGESSETRVPPRGASGEQGESGELSA